MMTVTRRHRARPTNDRRHSDRRTAPIRAGAVFAIALGCFALTASTASAQAQVTGFAPEAAQTIAPTGGWIFTPSMVYSSGWDDNVLIRGVGDNVQGDFVNLVGPAADLTYNSSRSIFEAHYSGGIELYRTLGQLNAYDQQASLFARRLLTKHFALFVRDTFSQTPTTQVLQLIGIPYVRTGSTVEDVNGGFDAAFTKLLSMSASYDFDWVQFDPTAYGVVLLGGHSHGGDVTVKYQLTDRTAITGNANAQFATVNAPTSYLAPEFDVQYAVANGTLQDFQTQNASVGIERKVSDTFRVFGSIEFSHLSVSNFAASRTGPAWNVGLSKQFQRISYDVTYSRSFVPAFGFGGTLQNEELTGHARRPLTRRTYMTANVAWMRNEPLVPGQLSLITFWFGGNVGYVLNRWARIEAYYGGVHQTIDQPGGVLDRNQFGIQIVTAKPMRIR